MSEIYTEEWRAAALGDPPHESTASLTMFYVLQNHITLHSGKTITSFKQREKNVEIIKSTEGTPFWLDGSTNPGHPDETEISVTNNSSP